MPYASKKDQAAYAKRTVAARRLRIAAALTDLKSNPCMDCGRRFHTYLMEYDHRPESEKLFDISQYRRITHTLSRVIAEIEKCDLLCCMCHRIRTGKRLGLIPPGPMV